MREALLGDLCEEFVLRGSPGGRRWYWKQALVSAAQWVPASLLLLLPGYLLPLWLLDRLWALLLSSIPLKEDAVRAWPMLAINLVVACLLGAAVRLPSGALVLGAAVLILAASVRLPLDYCCLFLVLPALASKWPARKVKRV